MMTFEQYAEFLGEREIETLVAVEALLPESKTDLKVDFARLLVGTRSNLDKIIEGLDGDLWEGTVSLLGIAKRAHDLLIGGLQAITAANRHMWAASVRGLIETIGAIAWLQEHPENAFALVQQKGIRVGVLKNCAEKKLDSREDYAYLSGLVHPNSGSLLLGLNETRLSDHERFFCVPSPPLTRTEAAQEAQLLFDVARLTYYELWESCVQHGVAKKAGRKIGNFLSFGDEAMPHYSSVVAPSRETAPASDDPRKV